MIAPIKNTRGKINIKVTERPTEDPKSKRNRNAPNRIPIIINTREKIPLRDNFGLFVSIFLTYST